MPTDFTDSIESAIARAESLLSPEELARIQEAERATRHAPAEAMAAVEMPRFRAPRLPHFPNFEADCIWGLRPADDSLTVDEPTEPQPGDSDYPESREENET